MVSEVRRLLDSLLELMFIFCQNQHLRLPAPFLLMLQSALLGGISPLQLIIVCAVEAQVEEQVDVNPGVQNICLQQLKKSKINSGTF